MPRDGMTGHLFEVSIFGKCQRKGGDYLPYKEARKKAALSQPAQKTSFAKKLESAVGSRLGVPVLFLTAVGTEFDFWHGVDGFLVAFLGEKKEVQLFVTLDLTRNPNKDCGKADLLVCEEECEDAEALAERIAREFRRSPRWPKRK